MDLRGDIVEETPPIVVEDKTYVAVGKDLKDSRLTLEWAIENRGGNEIICLLHVHQPVDKVPFGIMYTQQVSTYHKTERQAMLQLLEKYNQICQKAGVVAEVHYIEMDSIEKGIVEFVVKNNVKRLVIGAAADKHFSKKMVNLRSKKAIYVRLHAAASCQVQFICKGNVIFTRPGRLDGPGDSSSSASLLPNTNSDSGQNFLMPRSAIEGPNTRLHPNSPTQDYHRVMSGNRESRISTSSVDSSVESTPVSGLSLGRISDEWSGYSKRSPSTSSRVSNCSTEVVDDSASITYAIAEGSDIESEYGVTPRCNEDVQNPSPPSAPERGMHDELYDQLEQAMAEAESSKRDAFEESTRRRKAEKDAIESKRRVKASENLYNEELRRRREISETLEKTKEEHESTKTELNKVAEKLRMELEQKSSLESQIAEFDHTVQELEQKMFSAIEMLQNYKKERDELQVECDGVLRLVDELREKQKKKVSSSSVSQFYTEFDFSEVRDATRNFDPFLKIGEGAYGSTFRGFLRHTEVAVKMLYAHSLQGPSEFQQEVNVLCKLRHPNLVTVIGACPDARIIIYEYLSGGNLEDRLNCKDKTPRLSWQDRIRIAAELCLALIFLHSCDIVHGDLKPNKLLFDKNMVTKLSDFGNHHVLSQNKVSDNNTSLSFQTDTKSDTYSFGIILLRLLTGRDSSGLIKEEVQHALDEKKLKNILDSTAGNWPFVQAQQLATLALNCCDVVCENRPGLAFEVWRVLEPMRISCGLSSSRSNSEGQRQIPPYFICPISQETMQDPVVAADGFTYEAEVLKGWLDSGHNTSPMTNLKLASTNLVPNHALRSAIQEWLQQP